MRRILYTLLIGGSRQVSAQLQSMVAFTRRTGNALQQRAMTLSAIPTVTVVSGLPRSGTSMMMQVLAHGGMPILADQVRAPDADNPRGYFELNAAKSLRRDSSWVDDAVGKAVKLVHLLLPDLPPQYQYRVLFMERDLGEIVASQRAMLQRNGRPGADLTPERLAHVFQQQLQQVHDWLSKRHNFSVHVVSYVSMVSDPRPQAQAINAFLGGVLDIDRMIAAVDPALYRQRGRLS